VNLVNIVMMVQVANSPERIFWAGSERHQQELAAGPIDPIKGGDGTMLRVTLRVTPQGKQ